MNKYIIFQDATAVTKYLAAAQKHCDIINNAFDRAQRSGLLDTMTDAVLLAFLKCDTTPIQEEVKQRVRQDARKFTHRINATKFYKDTVTDARNQLSDIEAEITSERAKQAFTLMPGTYYPIDFAAVLLVKDGRAAVDRAKAVEGMTEYATPEQVEYIKEAEELCRKIVEFDERTRIMSNGRATFINDSDIWKPTIIQVNDGKIYFDRRAVRHIDPTSEEANRQHWASVGKTADNYKDENENERHIQP